MLSSENKTFLKNFAHLTPPIILQESLSALVNISSTIMIGRAMGLTQVTAVGISNQIFMAYALGIAGIVSGCSVFIGQYYGKGDKESIFKIMGIGFAFIMPVAAFIVGMAVFAPQIVLGIFTREPEIIEQGSQFIRIASISYLLFAVIFLRNGAMRAMRQTRIPMITSSVALLLVLIFNYIFIFLLNAPLYIIAMGTVMARCIELLLQEFFIRKYHIPIRTSLAKYFNFTFEDVKKFFRISFFIFLNMLSRSLAISGYMVAYGFMDATSQGAIQISTAILQLFQIFGASIGISSGIIMANTLGSGNRELAIKYSRKCLVFGVSLSAFMGILLILISPVIISFYQVDAVTAGYIRNILLVTGTGMILRTINFTNIGGILRNGGDVKFCFIIVFSGVVFIGLPLAFAGVLLWNLPIYLVVALIYMEEVFKAVMGLRRVFSNKWANTLV